MSPAGARSRHSSLITHRSLLVTRRSSLVTRHSSLVTRHQSLVSLCVLLACGAACAEQAAVPGEVPAAVTTTGGSRLLGMLASDRALVLRGDKGAQKLDLARTKSITFGERTDPNLENEARVALGDLQSDEFTVRDKAIARMRSLGRAALKPLKSAATAGDPEVANRARILLAEMGARNAADLQGDRVT
ncbi:MAG: hypothetical protein NTW87_31285, partial [Planctomycetota bacterium]|nr:hypothetical protein [Planctomycetota bacterium]